MEINQEVAVFADALARLDAVAVNLVDAFAAVVNAGPSEAASIHAEGAVPGFDDRSGTLFHAYSSARRRRSTGR